MKLALFVALATVVVVSAYTPQINSALFKPGEQYVYHYKGQVLSGIPKTSSQYAGLLIDSIVVLQFQQDYKVVMKMEKIKLFKINNQISTLPSELLPETELTHLTGEQATVITEHLVKPLKFRYDEGEVREIEKETQDRFWSVNIKKGILSLFQITLKDKNSFSSDSDSSYVDPTMSRIKSSRSSYNNPSSFNSPSTPYWKLLTKSNSAYNVMENDVTGNCENKYTLISDKTHLSASSSKMLVSVVRNFDTCLNKPFHIQGLFQGVYRYPTEKNLIQPIVHTDYVITGDRTHFLIKEATLRGKYFFLLNGIEGGDMSTYIFQHLTLKTTEPIHTAIRLTSAKVDKHGLLMVIPQATFVPDKKSYEGWLSGSSSSSRRNERSEEYMGYRRKLQQEYGMDKTYEKEIEEEEEGFVENSDIVSVVEMKLSELLHCLYPVSEKACSIVLVEVSRLLRQATRPQLKTLLTRYVRTAEQSSETEYRKAEILLDLLPTLPSPDAAKVLLELIQERQISEVRGTVLVKAMSLLVKPTPAVIKSVLELYKELPKERLSSLSPKTLLRQALLLSVGTLTHRLIVVMRTQHKVPEVISFIDSISSELRRMLEETPSETEKILILKSMGNMGSSETIQIIKQLIEDPSLPIKIRVNAVFALRRLAKQFNKQVVPTLLTTFMDVKEVKELREAAFVVIINANPSYTTLQMIAHRLRHEPHAQIRTLVYSSLINLAMFTSHEPEHKTLAKNARLIIKTIPPVHVGPQDSMSILINKFSEDLDLGGALNLIKIKSKMSGLPEGLIANLQGTLFGKHRRLLEVGVQGKSVEVILRKIFGPNGLLKEILRGQVTLEDFVKPLTRLEMGSVEQKIREFVSKMMVELRSEEEPFGSWYVHLLGNELQYIVLNSQNIEEVVSKVTSYLPELFMKLTRGIKVDVLKTLSTIQSLTIASPLGIPLSLNLTTSAILKVDGHIKVNNIPSWSEMINKYTLPTSKISLDIDIKPVVEVNQMVSLGANLRWLATGVAAEAFVKIAKPIKLSAHINAPDHSVTVKYFMPKDTIKVVHAKFVPLTFVKYFPTTIHKLPFLFESKEIKNEKIVKVTPFMHKYSCSISGMELETRGMVSLCGPTWCPTFFAKQEVTVVARPISSVDFVILKIKSLKSNVEFEGVPASRPTYELYEETEDEEETQNYRQTDNYRTSRRSMIESGEFEPIPVDPIFEGEPIKRQLIITLGPNTQQSPKVKALVSWLMGRQFLKNQINFQVVRLAHGETPAWKIHLNNVINPQVWYPEESYKGETEFLNKMHLIWNIGGEMKELKVKIIPGSPFDFTRELREHSILTTDNLPEANAQKYKYTVVVDLPPMTNKMVKYMSIVQDLIKYQFYSQLTTSIPHQPLTNKVIVAIEVLPWWEQMNIIVKTPREDSYITAVPFYWNPFLPTSQKVRLHDSPAWKWYSRYNKEEGQETFLDTVPYTTTRLMENEPYLSGKCTVSESEITTFDGVRQSMFPLHKFIGQGCEVIIAQDCSKEGLLKVTSQYRSNGEVVWKFIVSGYEFVTKGKDTKGKDGSVDSVTVNGEMMPFDVSRPIVIRDEMSGSSKPMYKYENTGKFLIFKAYHLGLTIVADLEQKFARYELSHSSLLQGQMCGLCGNFNQDQSDDLHVPFNTMRDEMTPFISFIRPETCDTRKVSSLSDDYCTKESHVTIRRYDNEVPMKCTSEKRVPQCAEGCRPENTESMKTCFTCRSEEGQSLPRKTYLAPRWDSYESGVECEDYFHRVEVPTRCVPAY